MIGRSTKERNGKGKGNQITLHHGKRINSAKIARSYLHMMFDDRLQHLDYALQIGGPGYGKVAWQTRVRMAMDADGKFRK
jgi:hypothetical protein